MAKKENLSLEELLEQAIVKDEEKPYEVPRNWVWTRLGSIAETISKGTTPKGGKEAYQDSGIGFLRVENIDDDGNIDLSSIKYIAEETHAGELKRSILRDGDILISIAGTLGRTAIVKKELLPLNTNQAVAFIRLERKFLAYGKYIEKALSSPAINNGLLKQTKVTSIPNLTLEIVSNCYIPIPPLQEQQRIVGLIESLFEKLDRAKELAQNSLDSFENRKAAILHKTYSGELTKNWRERNGSSFDLWKEFEIRDLIFNLNQGWSPKCESFPSVEYEKWGIIKTTAIQHMEFIEHENKQLPSHLKTREKHELKAGDILITRAGPRIRVGVCCLVKQVRPRLLLCDKAYRFRANEELVLPEYIVLALNTSDMLDKINVMKTGISDSGVNLTQAGFLSLRLNIPPLAEQQEIVRIVDKLLEYEQKAKELCDVIEKIENMKKAVLARAFRGELGTNDLAEESALALLKEVLPKKS